MKKSTEKQNMTLDETSKKIQEIKLYSEIYMILESAHDTTYEGNCVWSKTIAEAPMMCIYITLSLEDKSLETSEHFNDDKKETPYNPHDFVTYRQVNEICGAAYYLGYKIIKAQ